MSQYIVGELAAAAAAVVEHAVELSIAAQAKHTAAELESSTLAVSLESTATVVAVTAVAAVVDVVADYRMLHFLKTVA